MEFSDYMKEKTLLIEQCLEKLVPKQAGPYEDLFLAARYSLMNGGKRIRPLLTLAVCEALSGSVEAALHPACAIEMIHTYSMIHDDLPCMDDDDFRRGKPTLHKVFPEWMAVLAGDFLLTHAFQVLADAPLLSAEQKVALTGVFARGSGGQGMIAGQVMDLKAEEMEIRLEQLQEIHRCKTGALITAAIESGAIIANAEAAVCNALKEFACDLGLIFQIADDILDITQSEQKHGRAVASDVVNGKATYATLLGIEKSRDIVRGLLRSAQKKLESIPFDTQKLLEFAVLVADRSL